MSLKDHCQMLASYNQWMNAKIYEAARRLDASELARDRGAFFGSILGTLNHLIVGDTIWLKRFATHPSCLSSLKEVANYPAPSASTRCFSTKSKRWLTTGFGWTSRLLAG